ncbi:MAG TPA: SDR family oxidoreductase [Verrucomicrobiae bacterium]|jgi:NADP-dependent 3-hydroxy acid dehydrogenase YdfG|nr:SDR family oxidoreductase [Verrucomicrobiae bacterium]
MNTNGFSDVVMITGASAGIGRATARAFAKRGAKIGLFARSGERLEAAREEVEEAGGHALVLAGDVADDKAIENAAQQLEDAFGPIDIWVNNAMVTVFSPIAEMTPEEFRRVTEVTYLGYVWGTLAALRRMRPRNRGTIINVGSALAYRGIPLQSAYCAAKHAIHGFTEALRCELIHDQMNIRICEVEMPAVNTTQFDWVKSRMPNKPQPVPPIYQPEVAADAIVYAATHKRHEVYVGFPTVQAIVGNKIAPRLLDRYLGNHCYQSQQTDEPDEPDRPNNLFDPVPGDFGAHGAFDNRARKFSLQLWLNKYRNVLTAAVLIPAAAAAAVLLLSNSKKRRFL